MANRAFRWLRRRNAKEKPLPVQEIRLLRRVVRPAPPKEEPFDGGILGVLRRGPGFLREGVCQAGG